MSPFACPHGLEHLERRELLTASIGEDLLAAFKSGPFAKGDGPLASDDGYPYDVDAEGVLLDLRIAGDFRAGLMAIEAFGGRVVSRAETYRAASVRVPIGRAEAFVALPFIEAARMSAKPVLASDGGGEAGGGGPFVTGAGVKIGVLSDSVNRFA